MGRGRLAAGSILHQLPLQGRVARGEGFPTNNTVDVPRLPVEDVLHELVVRRPDAILLRGAPWVAWPFGGCLARRRSLLGLDPCLGLAALPVRACRASLVL